MNGRVATNPTQRHIHDFADTVPIDVVHGKGLDAMVPQNLLLSPINIPKTCKVSVSHLT
jgi:hypothetical protein